MEITGRLTRDAVVVKTAKDRQVVNFCIAVNDTYKPKDSNEVKKIVTFIDCSYWLSTGIAQWLKKGTMVELFGRIGVNAYLSSEGKAIGNLTFHTTNIKILIFTSDTQAVQSGNFSPKKDKKEEPDDLPF
ncbi:Single-stranded DNA-binding protein [Flavobacterium bizetiae]|uniref:Single-stranded DNA-binding protein n=1 Tax=Flavobacterium bizetiae TaxID=2704140 RepID=A0A6J4GZX0_9FLAO|nr:single-stranded DNA-binding protein [Flavobacterium bizetiae]CAA9202944.1 Single-stranded DNA-binding protein [Flavobacterium bizetiae]CAD5343585.1 Single-stranded DNA-binding protein [Flavobacterium bizetiae]CAD5349580.1 Single-stranded DNA-binding protein [Flavobacterium bizetiae]